MCPPNLDISTLIAAQHAKPPPNVVKVTKTNSLYALDIIIQSSTWGLEEIKETVKDIVEQLSSDNPPELAHQ